MNSTLTPASLATRLAAAALFVALDAPAARATWSIVLADTETKEVGVASATCWDGQWTKAMMPVVRVGQGAANCQATFDATGLDRQVVAWALKEGLPPEVALERLGVLDPQFENRQIGVVDVLGRRAVHTGVVIPQAWHGGVQGQEGTLVYAICGNRLAGEEVLDSVRNVVLGTPGDLAEKLMQGMLAALAMGGDGRCSCNLYTPAACGAPPFKVFEKAAHVGFMVVARPGDADGGCGAAGCATGDYYLSLEVGGVQSQNPDPVLQLHGKLQEWRASWVGRPDHYRSEVVVSEPVLGSHGVTESTLTVRLIDWQGTPLHEGGALVSVTKADGSDDVVNVGPCVDREDGTYVFPLTAKGGFGRDLLRVTVDDGAGPVLLHAVAPAITANPHALDLSLGGTTSGAASSFDAVYSIDGGAGLAGLPYLVLASLSGHVPGVDVGSLHVPLNPDVVTWASVAYANSPAFAGSAGSLDDQGRASFQVAIDAAALLAFGGETLTLVALTPGFASSPVGIPLGD